MNLTITNPPVTFWDGVSNDAFPALLRYGYSKYFDGVDKYIYVIANADGTFKDQETIDGYTWVRNVRANAGFSDVGNYIQMPAGNTGLFALSEAFLLGWYLGDENTPQNITYASLAALNLDGIDPKDLTITVRDGVIRNLACEPYIALMDVNGEQIYDSNGEKIFVIKDF